MVTRKEFTFPAKGDGHLLYGCVWTADGFVKYKGIIQIAHGMEEHILRYEKFAAGGEIPSRLPRGHGGGDRRLLGAVFDGGAGPRAGHRQAGQGADGGELTGGGYDPRRFCVY